MSEGDTTLDNTDLGTQDTGASPQDALGGDLGAGAVSGEGEASSVVVGGAGEGEGYGAVLAHENAFKKDSSIRPGGKGGWIKPYTSETARAAVMARWDKAGRAARAGMVDASKQLVEFPEGGARNAAEVLRVIVAQHTLAAYDPSQRGSQSSARWITDLAFPAPDKSGATEPAQAGGLSSEQEQALAEIADKYIAYKARASGDDV